MDIATETDTDTNPETGADTDMVTDTDNSYGQFTKIQEL
jgi:hypothetical protein